MIYVDSTKLPKQIIAWSLIAVLVLGVIVGVVATTKIAVMANNQRITCALFDTQEAAQQKYNSNPERFSNLDGYDKDGIVCEYLK